MNIDFETLTLAYSNELYISLCIKFSNLISLTLFLYCIFILSGLIFIVILFLCFSLHTWTDRRIVW